MPTTSSVRTHAAACLLSVCLSGCAWLPDRGEPAGSETVDAETVATPSPMQGAPGAAATAPGSRIVASGNQDLWRTIGIEMRMAADPAHRPARPLSLFGDSVGYVAAASERARPFLWHIYAEIERRELPFEIALVPIIESAYDPMATSPSGAAGIWQFMPATARHFGLKQSRWYDGRRDVVASTRAALDYFEVLRDRFMGDWKLVFAAYNCGERTVERAIERNARLGLPIDFQNLDLPRATLVYVPKLLALVEIVADPAAHGIELANVPSEPYFEAVDVGGALDLNRVITWSGASPAEFDLLNAGFRKRLTVEGVPSRVLVPVSRVAAVTQALSELAPSERSTTRVHSVASGETLSHIAAATGISVATLKHANGLRSNRLSIGQSLTIPGPAAAAEMSAFVDDELDDPRVHVVADGDNLWTLARRYDTSVARLAKANRVAPGSALRVGRVLKLPTAAQRTSPPAAMPVRTVHYEVQQGDSLWTIAKRFKISVVELKRWNRLDARRHLQPGQRLVVERPAASSTAQDI